MPPYIALPIRLLHHAQLYCTAKLQSSYPAIPFWGPMSASLFSVLAVLLSLKPPYIDMIVYTLAQPYACMVRTIRLALVLRSIKKQN